MGYLLVLHQGAIGLQFAVNGVVKDKGYLEEELDAKSGIVFPVFTNNTSR
jgi:hypothetical protein